MSERAGVTSAVGSWSNTSLGEELLSVEVGVTPILMGKGQVILLHMRFVCQLYLIIVQHIEVHRNFLDANVAFDSTCVFDAHLKAGSRLIGLLAPSWQLRPT